MTWKNISIKKYKQLNEVLKKNFVNEEDKAIEVLATLHDKPKEYFTDVLPAMELKALIEDANFIYSKPTNTYAKKSIKINGTYYNLQLNISELNAGEYRDISTLCKDENTATDNLHLIISLFLSRRNWLGIDLYKRWKNKAKTETELIVVQSKITKDRLKIADEVLENLTMDKAFELSNYFFLLSQNLIKGTQDYLTKKAYKEMKKANNQLSKVIKKDLRNIGGGSSRLMRLLTPIFKKRDIGI